MFSRLFLLATLEFIENVLSNAIESDELGQERRKGSRTINKRAFTGSI